MVIGDAARVVLPLGGYGGRQAMEDATVVQSAGKEIVPQALTFAYIPRCEEGSDLMP